MAWKVKLFVGALFLCLIITLFSQSRLPAPGEAGERLGGDVKRKYNRNKDNKDGELSSDHLAVIVPYRDRFEELQVFAPYIHNFLNEQNVQHTIFIVSQVDKYRFNRAALINVGYKFARKSSNYLVMHDVDLLPLNPNLSYKKPDIGHVMHVAAPGLHPKYEYSTFVGGILIVNMEDFARVNGMSNLYWGWGLEDDEFYVRLKQAKIVVDRPTNISTNKTTTFKDIHAASRPRDFAKCFDQYNRSKKRDRLTGVKNVNYTLVSTTSMVIENAPVKILNVKLKCDFKLSPWCDCTNYQSSSAKT